MYCAHLSTVLCNFVLVAAPNRRVGYGFPVGRCDQTPQSSLPQLNGLGVLIKMRGQINLLMSADKWYSLKRSTKSRIIDTLGETIPLHVPR